MAIPPKGLLDIKKFNAEQLSCEEDDIEKGLCPQCDWTLKINERGEKACPICGRFYN